MNDTQRMIEQALSLRQPQKDSLDILAKVLEKIEWVNPTSNEDYVYSLILPNSSEKRRNIEQYHHQNFGGKNGYLQSCCRLEGTCHSTDEETSLVAYIVY